MLKMMTKVVAPGGSDKATPEGLDGDTPGGPTPDGAPPKAGAKKGAEAAP